MKRFYKRLQHFFIYKTWHLDTFATEKQFNQINN